MYHQGYNQMRYVHVTNFNSDNVTIITTDPDVTESMNALQMLQ